MKRIVAHDRLSMSAPLDEGDHILLRRSILWSTGALLALYVLGLSSLGSTHYVEYQVELFLKINRWLSGSPMFWQNVTELGDAWVLFPFFSFLIYRNPRIWAALFGAVPLSALLSSVGKHIAAIPRPAAILPHDQFTILGPALSAQNSLPSGHTITVFAVVTVIVGSLVSFKFDRAGGWWILTSFSLATFVSASRVAVGAHWPLDVVFGAYFGILGGVSGILIARHSTRWWDWLCARWAQGLSGVFMLLWGAALGYDSVITGHNALVVPWIAALCAVAVGLYLLLRSIVPRITLTRRTDVVSAAYIPVPVRPRVTSEPRRLE